MGKLLCGLILLAPILTAIVAKDWTEKWAENGEDGFDLDWFWMGSNLRSLGRPKFKISEHPDGYSAQFGYEDYYARARYTLKDNSIDFNIMNWKGSAKFTHKGRNSPVDELTAEMQLTSPCGPPPYGPPSCPSIIDGDMKMKYSRPEREKHVIELSVNNIGLMRTYTRFPTFSIRNVNNMEAVLRIVINTRSLEESTAEFRLGLKGLMYPRGGADDWAQGSYNLSSSLTVIQMDYSNEKQPKMAAALDFSEDIRYDNEDQNESPRNEDGLKKSVVLSGMINLSNEGERLAVLKATDAETDKPFGRMEALRPDKENCRMELYFDGEKLGALNLQHSPSTMELAVETDETCGDSSADDTEVEDVDYGCNKYRLLELDMKDKDTVIGRMYGDLGYVKAPPAVKDEYIKNNRTKFHEHILEADDDQCGYDMSFSSLWSSCKFSGSMRNDEENTMMEHAYLNSVYDYGDKKFKEEYKMEMSGEMYPVENEEYNLKLKYDNERIFEGWTKWQDEMRQWVLEHKGDMKEMVNGMHEMYGRVVEALSEI